MKIDIQDYEIIGDAVEIQGSEGKATLYANDKNLDNITYIAMEQDGNLRFWKAVINPSRIDEITRREILNYCLGVNNYVEDEIVMSYDIFIHAKYLEEVEVKVMEEGKYLVKDKNG